MNEWRLGAEAAQMLMVKSLEAHIWRVPGLRHRQDRPLDPMGLRQAAPLPRHRRRPHHVGRPVPSVSPPIYGSAAGPVRQQSSTLKRPEESMNFAESSRAIPQAGAAAQAVDIVGSRRRPKDLPCDTRGWLHVRAPDRELAQTCWQFHTCARLRRDCGRERPSRTPRRRRTVPCLATERDAGQSLPARETRRLRNSSRHCSNRRRRIEWDTQKPSRCRGTCGGSWSG